jgi:hypothetical protein
MIKLFSVKVGNLARRRHLEYVDTYQRGSKIADVGSTDCYSPQEKQKKDAEAAASGKTIKQTAGELRLQKGEFRVMGIASFGWKVVIFPLEQATPQA